MPAFGNSFGSGDHVEVDVNGDRSILLTGVVAGITLQHVIDMYIVIFDHPRENFVDINGKPWLAASFPNTLMELVPIAV